MGIIQNVENILYFDQTRSYTLALLNAFNNIKHFVKKEVSGEIKTQEEIIPIKFASYEKFQSLADVDNNLITSGNFNFLPRMALSFDGMAKNPDRATNKFNKISKKYSDEDGNNKLDYSYNSVPYDFSFILNIQARGLTQSFQIVEQILPFFRPTMALEIEDNPLFQEWTITQIEASDPSFDILENYEDIDINLVNVSIPLTVRGNLYSPITLSGPIKSMHLNSYIYEKNKLDAKLAWEYQLDKNEDNTDWKEPATKDNHFAPEK